MIKYDNENFWVHFHEVSESKLILHDKPVHNLIISVITDDKEAIDITRIALSEWFKEHGLT